MPRSCYLCKRKSTEHKKITLHKFPKTPEIRKKWIDACGLYEKDVSHIYICSHHFELPDNLVALKRLPPGAIPTVEIAVPNHSVELSNVSTIESTTVNTSKSFEVNIFNSDIMDYTNAVDSISEASTYHSLPIIKSASISNLSEVNITSPIVSNEMDFEVQPISEVSTYYSSSKKNIFPPRKKRLFAEPRYISEINTSDVSTPRRTRRLINFIKQMDQKKSKQIKSLQDKNRRLRKRIVTLQELVFRLKESALISEDAGDNLMICYG